MNGTYLRAIAFKNKLSPEIQLLLDNDEVYKGRMAPLNTQLVTTESILIDKDHAVSPAYNVVIAPGAEWLRASAIITMPVKEWDMWKMPQFILRFYKDEKIIKTNYIRTARALSDGETKELHFDASIPKEKPDRCTVFFWNADGDKKLSVDSIRITSF
jgi:hypothetical protein